MKQLAAIFSFLLPLALLVAAFLYLRPAPQVAPLVISGQIDRIVVEKSARRMTLWQDGRNLRSYRIALGFSPIGDKAQQGDGRTPEGVFRINRRNEHSAYHLSLGIDYPQARHRQQAQAAGVSPGGDIMIHGQPNELPDSVILKNDWTAGCIAVSNAEIRELWQVTGPDTIVEIRP